MTISDDEKARLRGRFPDCIYHEACDRAIQNEGLYPAYWCQCHHGRKPDDPEFQHGAMIKFAWDRHVYLDAVEEALRHWHEPVGR